MCDRGVLKVKKVDLLSNIFFLLKIIFFSRASRASYLYNKALRSYMYIYLYVYMLAIAGQTAGTELDEICL